MENTINDVSKQIALAALGIGAIKINTDEPFQWSSGTFNPIYNDNRMFLFYPEYRSMIISSFRKLLHSLFIIDDGKSLKIEVIAGTSTAGIPHATLLANKLEKPLIYIRDKPKDHGMKNQIEGIDEDSGLNGANAILIEDLISTGRSSVKAVQAIRDAGGIINHCFSIFNYELPVAQKMFAGKAPFEGDKFLSEPCKVYSLLNYSTLIEIGIKNGYINPKNEFMLREWMNDQENWGDNHGHPRVKK